MQRAKERWKTKQEKNSKWEKRKRKTNTNSNWLLYFFNLDKARCCLYMSMCQDYFHLGEMLWGDRGLMMKPQSLFIFLQWIFMLNVKFPLDTSQISPYWTEEVGDCSHNFVSSLRQCRLFSCTDSEATGECLHGALTACSAIEVRQWGRFHCMAKLCIPICTICIQLFEF